MSQIGSLATNCHEGTRSEYLAQYIFSSFGTSIPVPHQEDSGIDLYCSLLERVGQRAWPVRYFAVQVKSTDDPWEFTSADSVRWFVQFPLPLFFCVVTKKEARLRIYHTSPRFYVWSSPSPIEACTLIPGNGHSGQCTQWDERAAFSLSAPILNFTIAEALDEDLQKLVKSVLEYWISVDECNLYQVRTGLLQFGMPSCYVTNQVPTQAGTVIQGKGKAQSTELGLAIYRLADQLEWVTEQLFNSGDLAGALRGALLFRHLFPGAAPPRWAYLFNTITHQLGLNDRGYLLAGIDEIDRSLAEKFPVSDAPPAPTTFGGRIHPPPRSEETKKGHRKLTA
jgi:hypothetical protein